MSDTAERADLRHEAERIARALVGESATEQERERYAQAITLHASALSGTARAMWSRMLRRPGLFAVLDAGLAVVEPGGPIRQRVFIMLAILEASPAHAPHFLPPSDGRLAPTYLLGPMITAVLRAAVGVPLVLLLRRGAR